MFEANPSTGGYDSVSLPPPLENLGFLGCGGQGMTWLALDPRLNRKLVSKRFKTGSATSQNPKDRLKATFAAQAKVAAMTQVVPQIYSVKHFESAIWLLLEFVEGASLQRLKADKKVKLGESHMLLIALDLIGALNALQSVGLVHGDLTPSNILINEQGKTRLIDFSSSVANGTPRTTPGTLGFVRSTDSAAKTLQFSDDQYAAGCVLYWLLSAELPMTICDPDGRTVVARAKKPEACSACANLLWDTAKVLTDGSEKSFGVLEKLIEGMRWQVRLLPPEIRSVLGAHVADARCLAVEEQGWARQTDAVECALNQSNAAGSNHSLGKLWQGFFSRAFSLSKLLALLLLITFLGYAGYLNVSRMPLLTLDSIKVAANTTLPSGFSHNWLVGRLKLMLRKKIRPSMASQPLIAALDCDHYTCVLSLDHQVNGISHPHQQSFTATAQPEVWESVIIDLGRAVEAR